MSIEYKCICEIHPQCKATKHVLGGSSPVDNMVSRAAFDALLAWMDHETRGHILEEVKYREMMNDVSFSESYKYDIQLIRFELNRG